MVKTPIITSHMRLAISIVTKYALRYPYIIEDMVSATLMGLCQAVEWAPARLYNNNITPYIYATCERFVRDFIEDRLVIRIPRASFMQLREDKILPLVQSVTIKEEEDNYDEYDLISEQAAKPQENPLLFDELLECWQLTKRSVAIVKMLVEGYDQEEIGKELGLSRARVCELIRGIRERIGEENLK